MPVFASLDFILRIENTYHFFEATYFYHVQRQTNFCNPVGDQIGQLCPPSPIPVVWLCLTTENKVG